MIILKIYLIGLFFFTLFMIYRHFSGKYEVIPFYQEIIFTIFYPIILLYELYDRMFPKRFVHYFDKTDTPYPQEWQPKRKYHKIWKRLKYKSFLGHKVIKTKWFDLITIYKRGERK